MDHLKKYVRLSDVLDDIDGLDRVAQAKRICCDAATDKVYQAQIAGERAAYANMRTRILRLAILPDSTQQLDALLQKTLNYYGIDTQLIKTIEELQELHAEINKVLYLHTQDKFLTQDDAAGKKQLIDLTSEIADVQNMLDQLIEYYHLWADVRDERMKKMLRQQLRIDLERRSKT